MIEVKTIGVWGFEGAIRGMRMPYESFDKSDSGMANNIDSEYGCPFEDGCFHDDCDYCTHFCIGEADMTLGKKLIAGGSEHRKFMRMIHVQAEVRAPRYWWAEMDKYKWVEANSSSTMHLITKRHLTEDDFSHEYLTQNEIENILIQLNTNIDIYNTLDKKDDKEDYFMTIKQLLPESYMQLRLIDTNYECLLNIYHQRKNHRLEEWSGRDGFCSWIESLLYMKEFLCV